MKLFVNSADVEEIKEAVGLGIISGVTTNPSKTASMGKDYKENLLRICEVVDGPVCAQVMSTKAEQMIEEAKVIDALHDKTLVKIPMGLEGVKAIKELSAQGIKVNTTVVFSVAQAILCLNAGTDYVSVFTGPYASKHDSDVELIPQVKKIITNYNYAAKIIDCVRSPMQTVRAALAGADICTMDYPYIKMLFDSPYTDFYMNHFNEAWRKVYGDQTWR